MTKTLEIIPTASENTFVSRFNPVTGSAEWTAADELYDFEQEIAQSGYADMLHDSDRNRRYYQAIRHTITRMKAAGKEVHVLDIGSGTGLLSMMAARSGADSVVACEAFQPVASCAQRIIAANGLAEKIKLIHKHSTSLVLGEDLPRRANLLVAELFDTELIGEGALMVYRHASENLLTPDATLIPCIGKMYLQVLESPFLWSHNQIQPFNCGDVKFPSNEMNQCPGSQVVFDLQASRLQFVSGDVEISGDGDVDRAAVRCLLEKPLMFHEFHFGPPSSNLKLEEVVRISETEGKPLTAFRSGTAHALLVWWDLQMEPTNEVPAITMAPVSSTPELAEIAPGDTRATPVWREHWMQAVYFPRGSPLPLKAGQAISIDFAHDSHSMHFGIALTTPSPLIDPRPPFCQCLAHIAWPRSRFAQLNHPAFRRENADLIAFIKNSALQAASRASNVALIVASEASPLSLQLAHEIASPKVTVFHLDSSPLAEKIMQPVLEKGSCGKVKFVETVDSLLDVLEGFSEILVVSEPFVTSATLPWNAIHFWYVSADIQKRFTNTPCRLLTPTRLRIWAVAVSTEHLWKIRAPVGSDCEGFDLCLFDDMILAAAEHTDALIEPHSLWEYAGSARSPAQPVFEMSFVDGGSVNRSCAVLPLGEPGSVNVVALWADWLGADGTWRVVGGPRKPVEVGQEVEWCRVGPQPGVFFLKNSKLAEDLGSRRKCCLKVDCEFDFEAGEPNFTFGVE